MILIEKIKSKKQAKIWSLFKRILKTVDSYDNGMKIGRNFEICLAIIQVYCYNKFAECSISLIV